MYSDWLLGIFLFIALLCLFCYFGIIIKKRKKHKHSDYKISLVFIIKNQEEIIEGIIRKAFKYTHYRQLEIIAADFGSQDQTKIILEQLSLKYPDLKIVEIKGKLLPQCNGKIMYYMDLTAIVEYRKIINSIRSIMAGKINGIYKTKVMIKN